MNPNLARLQPYPFQKLAALFKGLRAQPGVHAPINLSIGEPKHATPAFIRQALVDNLDGLGSRIRRPRAARRCAQRSRGWLERRYGSPPLDAARQVLPVNGSREALFAFAQTVVDSSRAGRPVVMPNPFYQIYEGAALLAGAAPEFINTLPENGFRLDFDQLPESTWARYPAASIVCSPGNPTGSVMTLEDWERLFALSDRYGFVIATDECYSEIYFDEAAPPLGALQAAQQLGRTGFRGWSCSAACRSAPTCRACARAIVAGDARPPGEVPALPHLPRQRDEPRRSRPPAAPPGRTRRTCATTAACTGRSSKRVTAILRAGRDRCRCPTPPSTSGCARPSPTPSSPAACTKPIM